MIPARVHSSLSCDDRGEIHVCAQLQPQACKVRGVSFAESLKLVETIDRRIKYEQKATCLVICSSVSKSTRQRSSMKRTDIQVSRCAVRSALLSQRIAVQLVHDSFQHGGMHRKHIDGEAHMCRYLSSPMQ